MDDLPGLRTWTLMLPWTKPPLSMNDRAHWRVKAKRTAAVRAEMAEACRGHKVPALERVSVELHYAPADRRRRDPLNLVQTLKALEDGTVDAGVVPDDVERWVLPTMPVIDPPAGRAGARLYVVLRELAPLQAVA